MERFGRPVWRSEGGERTEGGQQAFVQQHRAVLNDFHILGVQRFLFSRTQSLGLETQHSPKRPPEA